MATRRVAARQGVSSHEHRPCPLAVRHDQHLPLPVRPGHHRPGVPRGAVLQTSWYRCEDPTLQRLTRFFGNLLLINVAVGVVTGLVQEFEFGMNWSNYSGLVGNIFGGPLAMEGLAAFFSSPPSWACGSSAGTGFPSGCTSPVSGWWRRDHAVGAFIMAANSWMQHPVGYVMNSAARAAAQQHLGAVHQSRLPVGVPARGAGVARDGRPGHAGGLRLAPAPQAARSTRSAAPPSSRSPS